FVLALLAFLCIALTLVVFFIWTYPANEATNNWTMIPDNWEQLRTEWEYSHAANAVITFAAFCAVTLSALMTRERTPSGGGGCGLMVGTALFERSAPLVYLLLNFP